MAGNDFRFLDMCHYFRFSHPAVFVSLPPLPAIFISQLHVPCRFFFSDKCRGPFPPVFVWFMICGHKFNQKFIISLKFNAGMKFVFNMDSMKNS